MQDIVYVLVNEAMPNYVKVGSTANLEQRIRDLDTTGVPLPFEGEETSLSAAAQKVLQNAGLSWKAVQGPMYWKYEDETLGERRYRMGTED